MRISEIFYSLQGEGQLIGLPSLFVRASGCNLRCTWCDTPYASWTPEGDHVAVNQILQRLSDLAPHARHVVVTGGEPLIMPDIVELCDALAARNYHITIETAATLFKPLRLHLASLSPKLSNSTPRNRGSGSYADLHERTRLNIPVIQQFIDTSPAFQLKFVVADPADLDEIHHLLSRLSNWRPGEIQLMPEGTDPATLQSRIPWIIDLCKQTGFRYAPRLHVHLFGNRRGT